MRSAKASIARPCSGVKNSHGPSLAATGGFPPFGSQGSAPAMVLAVDRGLVAITKAAVDRRTDLRDFASFSETRRQARDTNHAIALLPDG
jgi:hypothetical protein